MSKSFDEWFEELKQVDINRITLRLDESKAAWLDYYEELVKLKDDTAREERMRIGEWLDKWNGKDKTSLFIWMEFKAEFDAFVAALKRGDRP